MCAHVHTSQSKCLIDNHSRQLQHYSQWYLALSIPGSRLNDRNAPGAHLYCNCQPLKKFRASNELWKFNTTKLFYVNFFLYPIYGVWHLMHAHIYSWVLARWSVDKAWRELHLTSLDFSLYCSLPKKGPWAEQKGGGAFNHERAPTSCLERLKALKANNWTQNNVQWNH